MTGAGAGWTFTIQGDWDTGDTLDVSVQPMSYGTGQPGAQCQVPLQPEGVNQSSPMSSNYVGFSEIGGEGGVLPPHVEAEFPAGPAPTFTVSVINEIVCPSDSPGATFRTLRLTLTNAGSGNAAQLATVRVGWSTSPIPPGTTGPVMFDVGFGAALGPVAFTGGGSMGSFAVASSVTVTGQRASADTPRQALVRNSTTQAVSGPVSNFNIVENVVNALPPSDGHNPLTDLTDDPTFLRHIIDADPDGAVCLAIDRPMGNTSLVWTGITSWGVNPGASFSPNSAAAGPGAVSGLNTPVLQLPVEQSSNATPTTWTATGLTVAGEAYTDGPVYAYYWWVDDDDVDEEPIIVGDVNAAVIPANSCGTIASFDKTRALGYVQIATVTELAPRIFGADAEATAANAINHQFDYTKNSCIGNGIDDGGFGFDDDTLFGPSIFVARSNNYADGLGASYAAGSVNSGVLLNPQTTLHPIVAQTIRLQGAQTVFIAGGPLAISDAVVNQLKATTSYLCGGTTPRVDPLTGLPKTLNVIRIFGETLYDTNQELAQFVGAQPMASLPALLADGHAFNNTTGMDVNNVSFGGRRNTALLVTGEGFSDAIVGSVAAYGGGWNYNDEFNFPMPLIATTSNALSTTAMNAIWNQNIGQVLVLGGPFAVSDSVLQALEANGIRAVRIAGQTNTDTSVQFASFALAQSGLGWLNVDFDWDSYVNRTAGDIDEPENDVVAHVVLLARGDDFADGTAAAAVLSVHNGRWENDQKFPLVLSQDTTTLGSYTTGFLNAAGKYISTLPGATPAGGWCCDLGENNNDWSSSVFTIQPVGGPLALSNSLLSTALGAIIGG